MDTSSFALRMGLAAAVTLLTLPAALAIEAEATSSVNVRSGPGTEFDVVDTLYDGENVEVVECTASETWCRITHSGPDGWVSRSYLDAPSNGGPEIEFGVTIPLPGGGSITFGTPGYIEGDGDGDGDGDGGPPPGPPQVCVYDLPNYAGTNICVDTGVSAANVTGFWNNRVTSLRVTGGASVRFCQNPNFGGFCNTFSNDVPLLGAPLNNNASSYDVLPPEPNRVCVYDLADYQGDGACFNAGVSNDNLGAVWNDKISSFRLFGGASIRLCQNALYGGFCNVFHNDGNLGGALNNQASSIQTW